MIIRQMLLEDLEQVCEIEEQIFSKPWSQKGFKDALNKTNNIYLLAEIDKMIVGYCGLWNIAGEGQITNVAVKEEFRNQKVGTVLLSRLIEEGRKKQITTFTLEVRESNQYAIRLYQYLGFKSFGIRKDFYQAPKENAIIMWLQ